MAVLSCGDTPDASLVRWAQNLPKNLQVRMVKMGLLNGRFASAGKLLAEHVAEWEKVLQAKGNTPGHVLRYKADVERIVAISKSKYLADLTPSHVQRALATMRDGNAKTPGLSLQTCNHALRAVKSFSKWMVADRRAAARKAWLDEAKDNAELRRERDESDFLVAKDASGCVADFHALRHTYITRVVKSGVTVKMAQELARHSTPVLTLGVYSHIGLHDTSKAVNALPSLKPTVPTTQAVQLRKTGTDG